MRRGLWPLLLVACTFGCSYGFGDLHPIDAGLYSGIDPRFSCSPITNEGCTSDMQCQGNIEADESIRMLACRRVIGSTGQGSYCGTYSFCLPGLVCWVDPSHPIGAGGTCEEPCFTSSDCTGGRHCDMSDRYRFVYNGGVAHRCLP